MADRPYVFRELTNSLCTTCLAKVEAKVVFQDDAVWLLKHCPEHGEHRACIADDIAYYEWTRRLVSAGQMPLRFNTAVERGCPFDCGLCKGHEQHSCLALIEITGSCDLDCPVCYADACGSSGAHRSIEQFDTMLDAIVQNEGKPPVVQITGGEPTLHPRIFEILDRAKASPVQHWMLATNGLRIADDPAFAERLADYLPRFEVYLQFDSLRAESLLRLRGADLRDVRRRAVERLNALGISTTLVVTLQKGVNDGEMGEIVEYALEQPSVRGVTFQPVQEAGRLTDFDPEQGRMTLSEARRKLLEQQSLFEPSDVVPVPCHADGVAMAYALKLSGQTVPLTRHVDLDSLLERKIDTIAYEGIESLKEKVVQLFSAGHSPDSATVCVNDILRCVPLAAGAGELKYENVFRVIIMQFLDAHIFDVRGVKRSCVHFVHPDGRIIPFDTYNLFYRDGCEGTLAGAVDATRGFASSRVRRR